MYVYGSSRYTIKYQDDLMKFQTDFQAIWFVISPDFLLIVPKYQILRLQICSCFSVMFWLWNVKTDGIISFSRVYCHLEIWAGDESFGSSAAVRECLLSFGKAHTHKKSFWMLWMLLEWQFMHTVSQFKRELHKAAQKFSRYTGMAKNT